MLEVTTVGLQKIRRMARRTRALAACEGCKKMRLKCTGYFPCPRCTRTSQICKPYHQYAQNSSEFPSQQSALNPIEVFPLYSRQTTEPVQHMGFSLIMRMATGCVKDVNGSIVADHPPTACSCLSDSPIDSNSQTRLIHACKDQFFSPQVSQNVFSAGAEMDLSTVPPKAARPFAHPYRGSNPGQHLPQAFSFGPAGYLHSTPFRGRAPPAAASAAAAEAAGDTSDWVCPPRAWLD